jgi:hypothetical protein
MYNFTSEDAIKSQWWKKDKVGDSIQGTLVNKRQQPNQLSGTNQWVYELMLEDGTYWNVGGSVGIDVQMRNVKLGQIVKFEFIEERPSKKAGMSATKVVQVYSNKNAVNKEWMQEQDSQLSTGDVVDPETLAKEYGGAVVDDSPETALVAEIEELAMKKFSLKDKSEVVYTIQQKTGLAYIEQNLVAILQKLKETV